MLPIHDSELSAQEQALAYLNQEWDREIVPRLPALLTEKATLYRAFERARALTSATDLLRGALTYAFGSCSFQTLGAWATLIDLANISASAWRRRLLKSNRWLQWLLSQLLLQVPPSTSAQHLTHGSAVWLIDGTSLKRPGGTGNDCRLHVAYDWIAGRLVSLTLTDEQTGEGFWHLACPPNTILVGDRIYSYRDQFFLTFEHHLFAVVRTSINTFPCLDEQGNALDVRAWLREQGEDRCSRWVLIEPQGKNPTGKRLRVRLVAQRITGAARERERAHAKRRAAKHGHQIQEQTLEDADWILVASTVPETWSEEEILLLYRARWQIELLFKRMKSLADLATLPAGGMDLCETYLRAWFVGWLLQERTQEELREALREGGSLELWESLQRPLSRWSATQISLRLIRLEIMGTFTRQRLYQCAALLERYLCPRSAHRVQWESHLSQRLGSLLAERGPPHCSRWIQEG